MTEIAELIARLRAWQVFVLLLFPMILSQFYLASNLPSTSTSAPPPSMEEFEALFRQTMVLSFLLVVLVLTWLLSIGFAANRRLEKNLRPSTRLAAVSAAYAATYIGLAQFIWPGPATLLSSGEGGMAVVVPFHLLAMLALFYVMVFAARNLIMAERQSSVSFFDYSGPFFLMWFFPLGVWFVQPRINRLVLVPVSDS